MIGWGAWLQRWANGANMEGPTLAPHVPMRLVRARDVLLVCDGTHELVAWITDVGAPEPCFVCGAAGRRLPDGSLVR